MRVLFNPMRSDTRYIEYEFFKDRIIAYTYCGKDVFDFTDMADGELKEVNTALPYNSIVSAKKTDGELEIILDNYLGKDATYEERFPQWIEIGGSELDG